MKSAVDTRPAFAFLDGKSPNELFAALPTPCYIIDESALMDNCKVLASVKKNTGCKILLAQKAFSNFTFYPLLSEYLSGTEASGLYEARLGKEKMPGGEVHVFCTAYRQEEFGELLQYADHIVFNSIGQLKKFVIKAKENGKSVGLRINPECSTQKGHVLYDPCAVGSRLGVTREQWDRHMTDELLGLLDGVHFHTLCEQNADALAITLSAVEEKFGDILPKVKWLNMGGGHHITRADYNIAGLEKCIQDAREKWNVQVYLEPGEAVALNAGYLATRVLDVVENGGVKIAILDASAACHMPDVIEMPYTPPLYGAGCDNPGQFVYRLGGPTCLAGDVIGDYAFSAPLRENDLLLFGDMAIYTTCKNNTFNGIPLPNIWKRAADGQLTKLTDFGYKDFEMRLG
jgi:carboxynorspermidine decarboxylase